MDYGKLFALRLSMLREKKEVSARDMSLSMGQNPGYINSIERGKSFPTMSSFFLICDYLGVTPMEFFSFNNQQPALLRRVNTYLLRLNERQLSEVCGLIEDLAKANKK